MADRTSAELFGRIFELVATKVPKPERHALAQEFYAMTADYDFMSCQMEVDDALKALGLAREVIDSYGDEVVQYLSPFDLSQWEDVD